MEPRTRLFSKSSTLVWGAVLSALFLLLSACSGSSGSSPQSGLLTVSPTRESIQQNLVNVSCLRCHTQATAKNRYVNLTDIMTLTVPGDHATEEGHHHRVLILPGCPKQSLFLSLLKEGKMPPTPADSVPMATLKAIEDWIISLKPDAGTTCEGDEPQDTEPGPGEP